MIALVWIIGGLYGLLALICVVAVALDLRDARRDRKRGQLEHRLGRAGKVIQGPWRARR